jgi:ABC-type antimicrobial peptide transport system permease subunit
MSEAHANEFEPKISVRLEERTGVRRLNILPLEAGLHLPYTYNYPRPVAAATADLGHADLHPPASRRFPPAAPRTRPLPHPQRDACRDSFAMMKLYRSQRTAFRALRTNVLRSALTTLGIVIGVAAVIAMTEIGKGTSTAVQRTIESMGANNLIVFPGVQTSGGVSYGGGSIVTLTPQDAEAILSQCPMAANVTLCSNARTQITFGNRNWVPWNIIGTTPTYFEVRNWTVADGEPFTDADVQHGSRVCLVGLTIQNELFDNESAVGREIRINNVAFRIIGVLGQKGANMMGQDQDDIVIAPWTAVKARVANATLQSVNQSAAVAASSTSASVTAATTINSLCRSYPGSSDSPYPSIDPLRAVDHPQQMRFGNIENIQVHVETAEDMPEAMEEIRCLLHERHHIKSDQPDDFVIRDMTEFSRALGSTAETMTRTLLFVALVSLVVGGVGIMNIMMVSVTERTKEIGLRMAVGARPRDILQQFLLEALVLSLAGGVIGILLGRGTSVAMHYFLGWPIEISLPAIVAAISVSGGIGVVFGYYPAWKASRLDPIEALRYE